MSTLSNLTDGLEPKDNGNTKQSDDPGTNAGEALAKFDFSHTDLGAQGPDHSDTHAALASMSCDDALDYAISHLSPTDHLDIGHFDAPADASHDT
jgi:hypothetical protein